MATVSTTLKQFIITASANTDFRAAAQMVHDALSNCNLVQTSDAGQINLSTVNYPGGNNQTAGTEWWRMNDSLQSTVPVYMRVDYGRGGDANSFRVLFTLSMSATNGSGVFTGVDSGSVTLQWTGGTRTAATDPSTVYRCFASGDTNRFIMAFFVDVPSTPSCAIFSVERTKSSDGTDNGDGICAFYILCPGSQSSSTNSQVLFFPFNPAYSPAWSTGQGGGNKLDGFFFGRNAWASPRSNSESLSMLSGGKVYLAPIYPSFPGWRYPLMNVLVHARADLPTDYSNVTIPFYGANHTYKPLVIPGGGNFQTSNLSNIVPAMRFE